jgi:predicted RNase H-like HicB family nuclease
MRDVHYIAIVHKDPDSGYGVSFPDVPGVTAVADTLDEAIGEAAVALGFAFEDWPGDRPAPRTLDALRADADFVEASRDGVVIAVRPNAPLFEAAE